MSKFKYYIEIIGGLYLNIFLFFLSWIVPKKKNVIVLGSSFGERFSGNPRYFCLYLKALQEKNINPFSDYYWITKNSLVFNELQQKNIPVLSAWSIKGFWKILRAEYLIVESGPALGKGGHDIAYQRLFMGRFYIVQTWHGSPAKHILLDALKERKFRHLYEKVYFILEKLELQNIKCILAMGEREKKILERAFNNKNVYILGYPKNDILIETLDAPTINFTLGKYDKIILYAPTFREHVNEVEAFSELFFKQLNEEMERRNWIFLVKKHPFDKYLDIPVNLEYVKDVTLECKDIQILLTRVDLLISDYSSIYVDFLLTGKQIIFYIYDIALYQEQSRKFYYDFLENPPGLVVKSEEELLSKVLYYKSTLKIEDNYKKSLEIFHKYTDSNSSKRLKDFLIKM